VPGDLHQSIWGIPNHAFEHRRHSSPVDWRRAANKVSASVNAMNEGSGNPADQQQGQADLELVKPVAKRRHRQLLP
jgi:hypothetical protein